MENLQVIEVVGKVEEKFSWHKVNRTNKIKEREVFSIGGGVYDFGDEDKI